MLEHFSSRYWLIEINEQLINGQNSQAQANSQQSYKINEQKHRPVLQTIWPKIKKYDSINS